MPQTRYIEEYKDGQLIDKIAYEVSDEQLVKEQKSDRLQELKTNIDNLTTAEKDEAFKLLLEKI